MAELLIRSETADDPTEAHRLLEQAASAGLTFKSDRWRWFVAHARLAARAGERQAASSAARSALEVLGNARPDFARHPDVGLVTADEATVEEIKALAGSSMTSGRRRSVGADKEAAVGWLDGS